jgi:hypothetical protein
MKSIVKLTLACNLRGKIYLCVAFHATTISFVKACTHTTNDNLHVTFHARIVCFIKACTTNRNHRNIQMCQD